MSHPSTNLSTALPTAKPRLIRDTDIRGLAEWSGICRCYHSITNRVHLFQNECQLEVGPFLDALPMMVAAGHDRWTKMHDLVALTRPNPDLVQEGNVTKAIEPDFEKAATEAADLIRRFKTEVVDVLRAAKSDNEEQKARQAHEAARTKCEDLRQLAETGYHASKQHLTRVLCHAALFEHDPIRHECSIVSVDMAQYGAKTDDLNGMVGAKGVFELNANIRESISRALREAGCSDTEVISVDTGDGALLVLGDATVACLFGHTLLKHVAEANSGKPQRQHQHRYRIGICTGNVVIEGISSLDLQVAKYALGGQPFGTAVRLQARSRIGGMLICKRTFQVAINAQKHFSERPKKVPGKDHEPEPILAHEYHKSGANAPSASRRHPRKRRNAKPISKNGPQRKAPRAIQKQKRDKRKR